MYTKIIKTILQNAESFIPLVFTRKQISVLKLYKSNAKLSNADKKALYTSIKKKLAALQLLFSENETKEYSLNGSEKMIHSRRREAQKLINIYSKAGGKVFISGSFLYSKEYSDIDIFILRDRGYKEEWDGNNHIIFLTKKKLADPIFQSAAMISVSNFIIPRKMQKKKPKLSELMSIYHEAVIEKIKQEKKTEAARSMVFLHSLFCDKKILDGKELSSKSNSIFLDDLDKHTIELCKTLFSQTYLYISIHEYIKTLKESIKNIQPNNHLRRYQNTYEELIYGRRRSKAEIN